MKSLLSVVVAGLSIAAFADGRDGLVHWWKVKDLNGDGLLQAGEVYDVMTVGAEKPLTGEHVYQSTDVEVGAKPVAIVNDVYMPTMRRNASDGAMRFYNPTNYTANGELKITYQSVKLSQSASIGSRQATVFARIKWDGARFKASTGNYNFNVPIYANNFNDKAKTGWMVGLRCFDSGTSNRFHPYFCFGNQEVGFHYGKFATEEEKKAAQNFVIYKDKWYDVVYSYKVENIDGIEKIHAAALYRSNDAGAVARKHVYKALPLQKVENTWEMSEESVYAPHIGFHRMADGTGGTESFVDAGKDDGFTGAIHEIKVYNRWMGENEMLQCLGQKDPICSVGSKNDCADEFCDNDVQEVFEPETMPWSKMRKTLHSQCPSVSINAAFGRTNATCLD